MNRTIALFFFLLPVLAKAQTDLLILQKNGMQVRTYTVGTDMNMQTVYNQWFDGTITDMHNDTVFVNGLPFSYKEIAAIRIGHANFGNTVLSTGMMVAGAGILVLGAANGLNRNDAPKDWYTSSGLITGAALIVVGYLLTKTRSRVYKMGRRYTLQYLVLGADRKDAASPPLQISPSQ